MFHFSSVRAEFGHERVPLRPEDRFDSVGAERSDVIGGGLRCAIVDHGIRRKTVVAALEPDVVDGEGYARGEVPGSLTRGFTRPVREDVEGFQQYHVVS